MNIVIVFFAIVFLIVLIIRKVNPMIALLITSILAGIALSMPIVAVMKAITSGVASTLGSTVIVIALGAMIGKLAEESGAAQKMVEALVRKFGLKRIQWAVLITGILAGIPLFYNAGFVVLIPLVFAIAAGTGLPLLYVGIPMAAALSVTHGFLPPHPGPVAISSILKANIGKVLLYGLILAIPASTLAGIVLPRLLPLHSLKPEREPAFQPTELNSSIKLYKSFIILLMPVLFIGAGTLIPFFAPGLSDNPIVIALQEPMISLLISFLITIALLDWPVAKAMDIAVNGVKSVAMILLIIGAGGGFKEILIQSKVSETLAVYANNLHINILILGWLMAAVFRIALGSATVAALTAAGLVFPLMHANNSPELMVLSIGAGSLFCSHVNDTGFWMFREYFGLSLKQTFLTWTLMESVIAIFGLAGVLILNSVMT